MSVLNFQNVHVTLVVVPTDLRCGYARLVLIAENDLGLNLSGGKEAIVFISKRAGFVRSSRTTLTEPF